MVLGFRGKQFSRTTTQYSSPLEAESSTHLLGTSELCRSALPLYLVLYFYSCFCCHRSPLASRSFLPSFSTTSSAVVSFLSFLCSYPLSAISASSPPFPSRVPSVFRQPANKRQLQSPHPHPIPPKCLTILSPFLLGTTLLHQSEY